MIWAGPWVLDGIKCDRKMVSLASDSGQLTIRSSMSHSIPEPAAEFPHSKNLQDGIHTAGWL